MNHLDNHVEENVKPQLRKCSNRNQEGLELEIHYYFCYGQMLACHTSQYYMLIDR